MTKTRMLDERIAFWLSQQEVGTRFTAAQAVKEVRCSAREVGWLQALLGGHLRAGRLTRERKWYTVQQKAIAAVPASVAEPVEEAGLPPIPNQRSCGAGDVARAVALLVVRGADADAFYGAAVADLLLEFYGLPKNPEHRVHLQHIRYLTQLVRDGLLIGLHGGGYAVTQYGRDSFEDTIWGNAAAEERRAEAERRLCLDQSVRDSFRAQHALSRKRQDSRT